MNHTFDASPGSGRLRPAWIAGTVALVLAGCAGASGVTAPASAPPAPLAAPAIDDPPRRSGKPLILVAMPDSESFRTVRRSLVSEIKKDFDVSTAIIDSHSSLTEFSGAIERSGPACLVLMDNPTVKLYRVYQQLHPG